MKLNTESIEIMLDIYKLKKKLIKTIVPKKTMNHLEVIANEIKKMIVESIGDLDTSKVSNNTGVSKVNID